MVIDLLHSLKRSFNSNETKRGLSKDLIKGISLKNDSIDIYYSKNGKTQVFTFIPQLNGEYLYYNHLTKVTTEPDIRGSYKEILQAIEKSNDYKIKCEVKEVNGEKVLRIPNHQYYTETYKDFLNGNINKGNKWDRLKEQLDSLQNNANVNKIFENRNDAIENNNIKNNNIEDNNIENNNIEKNNIENNNIENNNIENNNIENNNIENNGISRLDFEEFVIGCCSRFSKHNKIEKKYLKGIHIEKEYIEFNYIKDGNIYVFRATPYEKRDRKKMRFKFESVKNSNSGLEINSNYDEIISNIKKSAKKIIEIKNKQIRLTEKLNNNNDNVNGINISIHKNNNIPEVDKHNNDNNNNNEEELNKIMKVNIVPKTIKKQVKFKSDIEIIEFEKPKYRKRDIYYNDQNVAINDDYMRFTGIQSKTYVMETENGTKINYSIKQDDLIYCVNFDDNKKRASFYVVSKEHGTLYCPDADYSDVNPNTKNANTKLAIDFTNKKFKIFEEYNSYRINREKERLEKERLEKERLEKEKLEKEILEKKRLKKEKVEKEKIEKEKLLKNQNSVSNNDFHLLSSNNENINEIINDINNLNIINIPNPNSSIISINSIKDNISNPSSIETSLNKLIKITNNTNAKDRNIKSFDDHLVSPLTCQYVLENHKHIDNTKASENAIQLSNEYMENFNKILASINDNKDDYLVLEGLIKPLIRSVNAFEHSSNDLKNKLRNELENSIKDVFSKLGLSDIDIQKWINPNTGILYKGIIKNEPHRSCIESLYQDYLKNIKTLKTVRSDDPSFININDYSENGLMFMYDSTQGLHTVFIDVNANGTLQVYSDMFLELYDIKNREKFIRETIDAVANHFNVSKDKIEVKLVENSINNSKSCTATSMYFAKLKSVNKLKDLPGNFAKLLSDQKQSSRNSKKRFGFNKNSSENSNKNSSENSNKIFYNNNYKKKAH